MPVYLYGTVEAFHIINCDNELHRASFSNQMMRTPNVWLFKPALLVILLTQSMQCYVKSNCFIWGSTPQNRLQLEQIWKPQAAHLSHILTNKQNNFPSLFANYMINQCYFRAIACHLLYLCFQHSHVPLFHISLFWLLSLCILHPSPSFLGNGPCIDGIDSWQAHIIYCDQHVLTFVWYCCPLSAL